MSGYEKSKSWVSKTGHADLIIAWSLWRSCTQLRIGARARSACLGIGSTWISHMG